MLTESALSAAERAAIDTVPRGLFIQGRWRATARTLPVFDPATGEVLCAVADADPADGLAALDAACAAQREWAATPPRERSDLLMRVHRALLAETDRLGLIATLEMGKPLAEARGEIAYAAEFFRWFAEEAVRLDGGYMPAPTGGSRFLVTRQPVGPSLLITPWNFPVAMGARKIAPALAAGCTCVVKPAEQTPLSMLALAQVLAEAGLPAGVVNVVTTADPAAVMTPLILDARSRKLSFTGSTAVGKQLLAQCARTVMRTSMELGGNAPLLVFDDADLDEAVEGALAAKMRNIGQACTAANRILVQRGIADVFARKLADRMAALPRGGAPSRTSWSARSSTPRPSTRCSAWSTTLALAAPRCSPAEQRCPDRAPSIPRPSWSTSPTTPSCATPRSSDRSPRSASSTPKKKR